MPEKMETTHRRDFGLAEWVNFLAGVWLILSPFVLRYSTIRAALSAELTLGIILVSLSLYVGFRHAISAVMPSAHAGGMSGDTPLSWFQVPLGVLIILAPFIFGYAPLIGNLVINEILIGSLVILVSAFVAINHAMLEEERSRESTTRTV